MSRLTLTLFAVLALPAPMASAEQTTCEQALSALAAQASFVRNKLLDAQVGCRAVETYGFSCNWEQPEQNDHNGNCRVCAQLRHHYPSWLRTLHQRHSDVAESCPSAAPDFDPPAGSREPAQ